MPDVSLDGADMAELLLGGLAFKDSAQRFELNRVADWRAGSVRPLGWQPASPGQVITRRRSGSRKRRRFFFFAWLSLRIARDPRKTGTKGLSLVSRRR